MPRCRDAARALALLLAVAAATHPAAAATPPKTVKVTWQPPGNKMDEMVRES